MDLRCTCLDTQRHIGHAITRCNCSYSVPSSSPSSSRTSKDLQTKNVSWTKTNTIAPPNLARVSLESGEETSNYQVSLPPTPQYGGFQSHPFLGDDSDDEMSLKSPEIKPRESFDDQSLNSACDSAQVEQPDTRHISTQPTLRPTIKTRYSKVKKYYNRQNFLLDAFLGDDDRQRLEIKDTFTDAGRAKLALHASFGCDLCLVFIYLYASASTGSLSLQAITGASFVSFAP